MAADSAEAGYFTADVALDVEFDDGSIEEMDGEIRDFMEGGESLGNWYVEFDMDEDGDMMAEGKVGRATIDGDWAYTMHGQLEEDAMKDRHPAAVLGTFQLGDDGDPALLSGAFGTLNTDLD